MKKNILRIKSGMINPIKLGVDKLDIVNYAEFSFNEIGTSQISITTKKGKKIIGISFKGEEFQKAIES